MAQANALATKEARSAAGAEPTRSGIHFTPRVDIYETADEVVLLCDMPGVKPADVDVNFDRGELTLHGKVADRPMPGRFLNEEYGIGDFYRTFAIAPEINTDKIAAEYRDGVLTVHLPKREPAKPKQITVQGG